MVNAGEPRLFGNRWVDASNPAPSGGDHYQDVCRCLNQTKPRPQARVSFHPDRQDTSAAGWQRLLELIDEAADDGREEFRPLVELSAEERRQVITLPPSIAKLTAVKHFVLYGSNLVRIPPEIGAMTSLEEFSPYTSYRLHWFPFEITRCSRLVRSTVSTRALFGNYKLRPPFPRLQPSQGPVAGLELAELDPRRWGTTTIRGCSVCDRPIKQGGLHQVWISLRVATDVLPLLVNACSPACVSALPLAPRTTCGSPTRAAGSTNRRPTGTDRQSRHSHPWCIPNEAGSVLSMVGASTGVPRGGSLDVQSAQHGHGRSEVRRLRHAPSAPAG
ncbi:leucine-rich repeat domain-containing protein [Peterkaempfera sp. SMS 1(5)a]|uniref:leucine-rich repeat domain-containing protein n=1 Tax=Peterkaempfera podocarpi TaxID=3232308 RepID=UPI00366EAD84